MTSKIGFKSIRPTNSLQSISPTFIVPPNIIGGVNQAQGVLNKFAIPDLQAIVQNTLNGVAAQFGVNIWQSKTYISDDTDNKNLFPKASVMSVTQNNTVTTTSHPIETNSSISDHKFRQPSTFTVELIVDLAYLVTTRNAILSMANDSKRLYSIVSDDLYIFKNLVLESHSSRRDPQKYNVSQITLNFKEIMFSQKKTTKLTLDDVTKAKSAAMDNKAVLKELNLSPTDRLAIWIPSYSAPPPNFPGVI